MKSSTLFVIAFALIATCNADIWSNCGQPTDHLKISSVVITPDPPKIGIKLSIVASGTLDEAVTGGNVAISLVYGPITVYNATLNLCEVVEEGGLTCPLAQGAIKLGVSQVIPSNAPKGVYTGNIVLTDQNAQEMACIALNFKMSLTEEIEDDIFFNE